jgi:tetratricopeptide (TPR) repeat protein
VAFRPDGKAVLTGSHDSTARLWDTATGKPIGPPLAHHREVVSVAFSPDGKAVLTGSSDRTARLWTVCQLPDDLPRVADWAGVVTGLELDEHGGVRALDASPWHQRRKRLDGKGGPPEVGRRWQLDSILFGLQPTARARAWTERQRWAEAETAFDEAVLARPFDADVVLESARFHAARSRPDRAEDDLLRAVALGSLDPHLCETIVRSESLFSRAVRQHPDPYQLWISRGDDRAGRRRWADAIGDYEEAIRLHPEDPTIRRNLIILLAAAGDLDRLQRARSDVLDRFGTTTHPDRANSAAWSGSLAPGVEVHLDPLVRLADVGVDRNTDVESKARCLNTLGAALYRTGRFEDAIRRLEEGIKLRNGTSDPQDWPFLAMAHQRLGHRDQARRYLQLLRSRRPFTDPNQFWDELEIRVLQSEAEAMILYDPIFPAVPFAH